MKYLVENKYWDLVEDYNLDKISYLLVDRYDYVNRWNELFWKNKNELIHRNYDLPSKMWDEYGDIFWYKNGKIHRENNKPAKIWCDGIK